MTSTSTTFGSRLVEHAPANIRWRSWPLLEHQPWSWFVPMGVLSVGAFVWIAGGWALATFVVIGLAVCLWQFLLPVAFEVNKFGIRRSALGRTRLIPWYAIRAYQFRPTGLMVFQRADPTGADILRSQFIPFPADGDEVFCIAQQYLQHAAELPE